MEQNIKEYMMTQSGLSQFYASIPELPAEIKDKLLSFNILQLCALVSERPGPKWSGASDHYGPLSEIARRWKLSDLALRIESMQAEEPLKTYARIMQVIPGGNPEIRKMKDRENRIMGVEEEAVKERKGREAAHAAEARKAERKAEKERQRKLDSQKPPDEVATTLGACTTIEDLKKVVKKNNIHTMTEDRWQLVAGFKNFGLQRMYIGNAWRALIRQAQRKAHNLDDSMPGML